MNHPLRPILLGYIVLLALLAIVWQRAGHFHFPASSFVFDLCLVLPLLGSAYFFQHVKQRDSFASLLFGLGFLLTMSLLSWPLSEFALTIAGPRIDYKLAAIDRALGFDWPAVMAWFAYHPHLNRALMVAYSCSAAQVTAAIFIVEFMRTAEKIDLVCLCIAISGTLTVAIWTLAPSFGAITVYFLPPEIAARLPLDLNLDYAHRMVAMLGRGPGNIETFDVNGLVGFPSFHAVEAVISTWSVRKWPKIFVVFIAFNAIAFVSMPVQGGHHFIDLIGGVAVAAVSIWAAQAVERYLLARRLIDVETPVEPART